MNPPETPLDPKIKYTEYPGGPQKEMLLRDVVKYDPGPMTKEELAIATQITMLRHGYGRLPMHMAMQEAAAGLDPFRRWHSGAVRQYKVLMEQGKD